MRRTSPFGAQVPKDPSYVTVGPGEAATSTDEILGSPDDDDHHESHAPDGRLGVDGSVAAGRRSLRDDYELGVCTIVKGKVLGAGEFGVVYQGR